MQLSGVGDAQHLQSLGIPVVADLPGVGANLQDHLEVYIQYASKLPVSIAPGLAWWKRPGIGAQWLFQRKGLGATNHFEGGGFMPQQRRGRLPQPDVPLPAHRDPVRRHLAHQGPRLPGAHRADVLRRPRLGEDPLDRPDGAPVDAVQLPLDRPGPTRVGRGRPGRPQHPHAARLRPVQRRRALARPVGRDRGGDPRLGAQGRRDGAAPLVHRQDGRRRRRRARPRDHEGLRRRGPPRRRRELVPLRHQRQHLRAGDDARREGGRPDQRRHPARAVGRALLPLPRGHAALPTG